MIILLLKETGSVELAVSPVLSDSILIIFKTINKQIRQTLVYFLKKWFSDLFYDILS